MKVISVEEAKDQLAAICEEALNGETVRVRSANGSELELIPVGKMPKFEPLSDEELAACYDDPEWARFENNCAKASS